MKKIEILISVFLIFMVTGCTTITSEIVFFKIGQADSALLSINDKIVLIDAGETDDSTEIINYLKKQGIAKIDYLLISHYDKDHIGGALSIIDEFTVGIVYGPNYNEDSDLYNEFNNTIISRKVEFIRLTENITLDEINTEVFVSEESIYETDFENNMSLLFKLTDNEVTYLFLGDIEEERITKILTKDWTSTLVKLPHHGKIENNSDLLIDNINPRIAIITSSDKNKEDQELIKLLENANATTYITRNGNIYCRSNGVELTCKQEDV